MLAFFHMGDAAEARGVRRGFLDAFHLGEERAPLLRLSLGEAVPFSWG